MQGQRCKTETQRVFVLTDISNEPDDQESSVRSQHEPTRFWTQSHSGRFDRGDTLTTFGKWAGCLFAGIKAGNGGSRLTQAA